MSSKNQDQPQDGVENSADHIEEVVEPASKTTSSHSKRRLFHLRDSTAFERFSAAVASAAASVSSSFNSEKSAKFDGLTDNADTTVSWENFRPRACNCKSDTKIERC